MSQQIEQLKHGTTLIFPRTSQEAVLVNYKNKVQTLGDHINRTIITPNESPQNLKVQYNHHLIIVVYPQFYILI